MYWVKSIIFEAPCQGFYPHVIHLWYNVKMDLTSPKIIKELLASHQTRPSKGLGQNFVIHQPTLDKIMTAADLSSQDTVLEIGPGIGTLTQELAKKTKNVIAIEKDATMVKILQETLKDFKNVEIIQADALKISNFPAAVGSRFGGDKFQI